MQPDQRPTTRCEIRTRFATADELAAQLPLAVTPEGVFFVPVAELKLEKGAAVEVVLRLLDRTLALRLNGEVVDTLYDPLTSQSPGFWVRIPWDPKAFSPPAPPSAGSTVEVAAVHPPTLETPVVHPPTLETPAVSAEPAGTAEDAAGEVNEFDNPFKAVATNMLGLFIEFSLTEQSGEAPSLDEIPVLDKDGRLASFGFLPVVKLPPPRDAVASPPELPEPATAPDFSLPTDVAADEPTLAAEAEVVEDEGAAQTAPRSRLRFLLALAVGTGLGGAGAFYLLLREPPPVVVATVAQRIDAAVAPTVPVAAVAAVTPDAARSVAAVTPDAARSVVAVTPDAARSVVAVTPDAARSVVAVTPDAARSVFAAEPVPAPSPAPSDSARSCEVELRSSPVGAEVWLGDSKAGETPMDKLAVPCGGGTLTLKRSRYADLALDYQASPGKRIRLTGKMARPLAELAITSDPPGAAVLYRGKDRGKTPLTLTVPQFEGLSFELRLSGRQPVTRQLRLAEAKGSLSVSLSP